MARKVKVTDYKTKRINNLTGGKITSWKIPDYPNDTGVLSGSFVTLDGKAYLGDYARGWWYVRHNMLVCHEHPLGVSIILKHPIKDYPYLDSYKTDGIVGGDDIKGYYGFSHRGGQTFKIGDRLFDEKYIPKQEDYTKEEWDKYLADRSESIRKNLKDGWFKTEEEGMRETPISDVIPFIKRGTKIIETWEEAKQAAISISSHLS